MRPGIVGSDFHLGFIRRNPVPEPVQPAIGPTKAVIGLWVTSLILQSLPAEWDSLFIALYCVVNKCEQGECFDIIRPQLDRPAQRIYGVAIVPEAHVRAASLIVGARIPWRERDRG